MHNIRPWATHLLTIYVGPVMSRDFNTVELSTAVTKEKRLRRKFIYGARALL